MKLKKLFNRSYGLRGRFMRATIFSVFICFIIFGVLYASSHFFMDMYFENSDFQKRQITRAGRSLQKYIDSNSISSENLSPLKKWEENYPVILFELYANGTCIYSSFYESPDSGHSYESEMEDRDNVVFVQLTDMSAMAILYCDFTYKYYFIGTAASIIIAFVCLIIISLRSNSRLIHYVCRLDEEVQIIEGGNLDYEVSVEGNDEITDLAKSMNRMRESFKSQMKTEQRLYYASQKLVTEMSHDLRTPLTGILLYLEILRNHHYSSEEQAEDYLKIIEIKAHHMKMITDNLFKYALENSNTYDDYPDNGIQLKDMEEVFGGMLSDAKTELEGHGFSVVTDLEWSKDIIQIIPEHACRIMENIVSNLMKYADPEIEIYIYTVDDEDRMCGFSIINTFREDPCPVDSNGIGLDSIRNMMNQMNGNCITEKSNTVFEITLLFAKKKD